MQKITSLLCIFSLATIIYPTIDPNRPVSQPPRELTKIEARYKKISDFLMMFILQYYISHRNTVAGW
jgi:hypothetical protein